MIELPDRPQQRIITKEAELKWYWRDGTPCMKVRAATKLSKAVLASDDCPEHEDGFKLITPDLRHARKLGLYPSVTCVTGGILGKSAGIVNWAVENALLAAYAHPFDKFFKENGSEFETLEDARDHWIRFTSRLADTYLTDLAARGSFLHGEVSRYYIDRYEPEDPAAQVICQAIDEDLKKRGVDEVISEKSFVNHAEGYAGTPDLVGLRYGKPVVVGDLKTCNLLKLKKPHNEWKYQLGAYVPTAEGCAIVQYCADRDTGETRVFQHNETPEESIDWKNGFLNLLSNWCLQNRYHPAIWEEDE